MKRRSLLSALLASSLMLCFASASADEPLVGKLVSTGSDTLGALTSIWAEMLTARHPRVSMQVRAIGSGAAPTALIQGTADIGPMSRPMSPAEISAFTRKFGYQPTAVPVAEDALAVFVHRDNPLEVISTAQLDAIFSGTRRCGYPRAIRDWGSLGLAEHWSHRVISVYGRSAASGTYSVFRRQVLCSGDFAVYLNRLVGSSAVVRAVAMDENGIGYASAGYLNDSVKRLRVVHDDGVEEAVLARRLFVYINRPPQTSIDEVTAAFLDMVFSVEGQREVSRLGYGALDKAELVKLRQDLGLGDA
ncbi:phosphate ABC transporter substrate-binding protein [Congregibacter variabilis]|uniref:Phosphate ABC transporter substrate-binding protein n=1 Tax=Congregibacter variabilis TaxID=3081200 RepID=A0ABZ0I5Y7_9GAMM|nr:phosphate ABC transporter substrate-binding protein [Congregibacter sp. IMCC43200]